MEFLVLEHRFSPVEVDGFSVSFGAGFGEIEIARNGERCSHFYASRKRIENVRDYEAVMMDALNDFLKTAEIGGWSKEEYVEKLCEETDSEEDVNEAWDQYQTARKNLNRLLR